MYWDPPFSIKPHSSFHISITQTEIFHMTDEQSYQSATSLMNTVLLKNCVVLH